MMLGNRSRPTDAARARAGASALRCAVRAPVLEIAAHLGEVLWAMGRTDEARTLWREARVREPDNSILRETLARLNVAL